MAAKSAKIEIFCLYRGYSCITLWVDNSLQITLSLTFSEIFSDDLFSTKIQDGRQNCRKLKYFPFAEDTPVLLRVSKIRSNHSISYRFQDIYNSFFSAKIQDGRQKWQKLKFSPLRCILLHYPVGQKSLMVFKIFLIFYFMLKSKMAANSGENLQI